jgi:hypothetical protein
MESTYYRRVKAIFQLREKLKRSGVTVPADSVSEDPTASDEEVVIECDGKSETGNRRLRACFGR